MLMITLSVEIRNPLNQKNYDDILSSIQFHQLTCTCGHSACLSVHGYYLRGLKTPDGIIRLRICRLRCHECRRTHALLPSLIVPYSQVSAPDQADIIHFFPDKHALRSLLDRIPCIDENNVKYIMRSYLRRWKQRLLSCGIPICPLKELVSRCFSAYCRQFMQVKRTPNILFPMTT